MAALGLLYFLIFATVGAYMPWFPPLLRERGLAPAEIGFALALSSFCRALFPPLWGWLSDHVRRRRSIVAVAALASGAALVAVRWAETPTTHFLLLFAFGFFVVPVNPLAETITLEKLGGRRERYGQVRLWGSLGFIVTALTGGVVVENFGLVAAPFLAGLPLVAAAAVALALPRTRAAPALPPDVAAGGPGYAGDPGGPTAAPPSAAAKPPFPWRRTAPVLAAAALGQMAHGPYYTFFTLEMNARGVASWTTGALWAWAVLAEVLLMAASARLLPRLGMERALALGLGLGAVRWLAYAIGLPLPLLALGQTLHAASFAVLHLASIAALDELVPAGRKAFGQSIFSAVTYGIGGGSGLFLAGQFFPQFGFQGLYLFAAGLSVAGIAMLVGLRTSTKEPSIEAPPMADTN